MGLGWLIALAVIGAVGTGLKMWGDYVTIQNQYEEDLYTADQYDQLTQEGGYYDQQLSVLQSELDDLNLKREEAGKIMAIEAITAKTQVQSVEQKAATQGLQLTEEKLAGLGSVAAMAGVGNLAQSGSVGKQKEYITYKAGYQFGEIQTEAKAATQSIRASLDQMRIQYEQSMRSYDIETQKTLLDIWQSEYEKSQYEYKADKLREEADWLKDWGIWLTWGSDLATGAASIISPFATTKFSSTTADTTSQDTTMGGGAGGGGNPWREY